MSEKDERDEHKQTTQATAKQPQEEFIDQENIPSKTEAEVRESETAKDRARPRD